MLAVAAEAKAAGRSVLDYLDDLERAHGVHLTSQVTLRTADQAGVMRGLRAGPPAEIGGQPVTERADLADGGEGALPRADVLIFRLGGDRVVLRPSGTEPKAKIYLEICSAPSGPGMPDDVWKAICRDVDGLLCNVSEAFVRHALSLIGLDPSAAGMK